MKKPLGIVVLGLLLSGCAASWQEANHYTMNRDARINLFNNDIDTLQTIYVGIGSDADEKYKNMYYNKSLVQPKAQHFAPKEVIAKIQCLENFNLEKAIYKETLNFSKTDINKYRLGFKKYAKFSCEKSDKQNLVEKKQKSKNMIMNMTALKSNNKLDRSFTCAYALDSTEISKIKISGGKAEEITAIGIQIDYSIVNLSDKGAFSLQGSSKQDRAWFIGAQSFLLLGVEMIPYKCK